MQISDKDRPGGRGMIAADAQTVEVTVAVREAVDARRGDGLERAIAHCASAFGLSPRRVRSYWHGQVKHAWAREWAQVRGRAVAWMEAEIARTDAANALRRARCAALRARLEGETMPMPGADGSGGCWPSGPTPPDWPSTSGGCDGASGGAS